MIALASESANFIPERFNIGDSKAITSFRIIDCILLISRAALICEYFIPLLYMLRKRQRRVRRLFLLLLLCCLTFFISTIIYSSIIPTFSESGYGSHSYRACHYPFHLALALVLEGQVLWTEIANVGDRAVRLFAPARDILTSNEPAAVQVQKLNETFYSILNDIKYQNFFPIQEIQDAFNATYTAVLAQNDTSISNTLDSVITIIYRGLLADEGIQISDKTTQEIANSYTQRGNRTIGTLTSDAYSQLFGVSFIYYLVCAGVVLIMLVGSFDRTLDQLGIWKYQRKFPFNLFRRKGDAVRSRTK
ncbi:hypothetical protein DL95DRAFT_461652 [Leptodontidium sp. 2 PMI_412]|nr:hypothetical protein DL95DRAFT_461652 [Leptodontidium sp. 2 PMI_412]